MRSTAYAPYLWLFTALLVFRVAGQLLVVLRRPRWLPPMEQWQSGLVPYWFLLVSQGVVLLLMFSISTQFTTGAGFWVDPHPWIGGGAYYWSYLYAGAMVARYIASMARHPERRWSGNTIPIVFHTMVAAFQWTFGRYHVT